MLVEKCLRLKYQRHFLYCYLSQTDRNYVCLALGRPSMCQAVPAHSSILLEMLSRPGLHSFVCSCIKMELATVEFKIYFWVPVKGILPSYLVLFNSDLSFSKFLGKESGGLPQNSSDSVTKSVVISDPWGVSDLLHSV